MQDDGRAPADALEAEVDRVVRECVALAGVDGGCAALVTAQGHRTTVCATDEVAQRIEELQWVAGEGPCVDAATHRSPVLVADLQDRREGVHRRWPAFLDGAAAAGVRAVFAFPLRIGAVSLGAMDLYRSVPGDLDAAQLRAALLTADALSLLLLDLMTSSAPPDGRHWRSSAAAFKVHGAAGMAKVQLGSSIEHALAQLRAVAFSTDRSLEAVADDVIAGRLRFPQEDA